MALSKATWRKDLSRIMGDWTLVTTSGAGNGGGTTFVSTSRDGYATNTFRSWWALRQASSEYRLITAFAGSPSPATWTVTPAFSSQVSTSLAIELHAYRPDFYTTAGVRAVRMAWPYLFKPTLDSSLTVPAQGALAIVSSSAANPTTITTAVTHGLATNQCVTISGHTLAGVNGTWIITVTGATTFTIPVLGNGTGGTATIQPYIYGMPSGLTKEMITQVQMEGAVPFNGRPYHLLPDVSFSPDETQLWLNRTNVRRYHDVIAGRKLYLFAQSYLSALPDDATDGALTNDATATIELTATSAAYELLLAYGKWAMYDILAEQPQNQLRQEHRQKADAALIAAQGLAATMRMDPIENPWQATSW